MKSLCSGSSHVAISLALSSLLFAKLISAQTPLISGPPANAALRNNYSGFVGTEFTTITLGMVVSSLGRIYITGNNGTHIIKIVDAATNADVPGAFVSLTMTGGTNNTFQYASLPTPVQLTGGHNYYLLSRETAGGDQWYDFGPLAANNSTLLAAVYTDAGGNYITVPGTINNSYVPPNLLYSYPGPAPTVTYPTSGQVVSGNTTFDALAIPQVPNAFGTLQFYVDGEPFGPVLSPILVDSNHEPFVYNLSYPALLNGMHTVSALYFYGSSTVSSSSVPFSVTGGSSPLVVSQTLGTPRNNFNGFVGMEFETGSNVLQVTSLGRYVMPGNSGSHLLKLVDGVTGVDVPGASGTVNLSGASPGAYAYTPLLVTLEVNHPYYLLSQETAGGDNWGDIAPVITNNIAVLGGVYQTATGYAQVAYGGYSYVPVNLGYIVNGSDAGLSVAVTSPTANQQLPDALFNVQATVTLSAGYPVQSAQVLIDSAPVGSPVTSFGSGNTATIPLDVTKLSNGSHSLAVQATDSAGATAVSAPVAVQVNNGQVTTTAFITSFAPTTLRNNFTGLVGMQFKVGALPIIVSSLGRYCAAANNQMHTISIYAATVTYTPPLAQAQVNMSGCVPGQYLYAGTTTTNLSAGSSYYLVDTETSGNSNDDQWYDYASVVSTSVGSVVGAVYNNQIDTGFATIPANSTSYGPLNFLYTTPSGNSGGLVVSIAQVVPNLPISSVTVTATAGSAITSVQIQVDGYSITAPLTAAPFTQNLLPINEGKHTITAIATDAAGDVVTSAPYQATFGNPQELPPTQVTPVALLTSTQGTPRNNYTGWVGFQFSLSGNTPSGVSRNCAGDTLPHYVKLVTASTGIDVPNGTVWINCANGDGFAWFYSSFTNGVTYNLVSQETAGGDTFGDVAPLVPINKIFGGAPTSTGFLSIITVNGPVYFDGLRYVLVPLTNNSYVGLNLYGIIDPL